MGRRERRKAKKNRFALEKKVARTFMKGRINDRKKSFFYQSKTFIQFVTTIFQIFFFFFSSPNENLLDMSTDFSSKTHAQLQIIRDMKVIKCEKTDQWGFCFLEILKKSVEDDLRREEKKTTGQNYIMPSTFFLILFHFFKKKLHAPICV